MFASQSQSSASLFSLIQITNENQLSLSSVSPGFSFFRHELSRDSLFDASCSSRTSSQPADHHAPEHLSADQDPFTPQPIFHGVSKCEEFLLASPDSERAVDAPYFKPTAEVSSLVQRATNRQSTFSNVREDAASRFELISYYRPFKPTEVYLQLSALEH